MSHFLAASIFAALSLDRLNPFVAAFTNRVKGYHKIYYKMKKRLSGNKDQEERKKKRGSYFLKQSFSHD